MEVRRDLTDKLHDALPKVRAWIASTIQQHAERLQPISELELPRLRSHFPRELLDRTRAVTVARVPSPPLRQWGIPELASLEDMGLSGITLRDAVLVNDSHRTEATYFHELVHAIQWERLGVDRFLLVYGAGHLSHGFERNPLERIALSLERGFVAGAVPPDVTAVVNQAADATWRDVAPFLARR